MKLSVIIPYYNSDAWIGHLLDTLLDQDLAPEDYEILVMDDASPEDPATLRRYAEEYRNVTCVRLPSGGVSEARNAGIDRSCGDWIFFCDSDDYVRPRALRRFIDIAESEQLDMLFWNMLRVGPDEEVPDLRSDFDAISPVQTGWEYLASPPADFSPGVCRYLVRRSLVTGCGLRFQGRAYEDSLFRLDVMAAARRVAHVDVDFYFYVQRESSILHEKKRRNYEMYAGCLFTYLSRLSADIASPEIPDAARERFRLWRDIDAFYLLKNMFLYTPVATTEQYYPRLRAIGALPLDVKGGFKMRNARRLMNRRHLWMLLCRMFHILPAQIRQNIK